MRAYNHDGNLYQMGNGCFHAAIGNAEPPDVNVHKNICYHYNG